MFCHLLYRQRLLPRQMLLPYDIVVDFIALCEGTECVVGIWSYAYSYTTQILPL